MAAMHIKNKNEESCEDSENSLRAFVNGKAAGHPRDVELRDKDEIVIAFGKVAARH